MMDKIKTRWEFYMKTIKDIYAKILRQLILSLIDKEVKESLKKYEEKLTLKFNTWLVLMKVIEHVVRNATNTWKNVYLLHKPSDFSFSICDKDDEDDQEKDEEGNDEETMHFDTTNDEDE